MKKSGQVSETVTVSKGDLESLEGGVKMDNKDLFNGFDYDKMMEEQKQYEQEVKERWGHTEAYKVSMERTSKYTKEDWERINALQMKNLKELCELYQDKVPHDDPKVQGVVDQARQFISDHFYDCPIEVFSGLGQMYVNDKRFTAYYEKFAPGLAAYYNDAIQHYCIEKA